MMNVLFKQKLIAFASHLLISLMIALLSVILVYVVWYPQPLGVAAGVTRLFLLMITIDIIIGPLLTFIVYKKNKKTLKFDLSVIAILQIAALLYGLYAVYDGRPAWVAYSVDRFEMVRVNELDVRHVKQAKPEYATPPLLGYKYVHAQVDKKDIELKNKALFEEVFAGVAPSQKPELYQPVETAYPLIRERAKPLDDLYQFNSREQVDSILKQHATADSFVPLKANAVSMTVLINKAAGGQVVAIVDLRPWH